MSALKHTHTILYAEDDADDLFMVRQAFERFDNSIVLQHVQNGFDSLKFLEESYRSGTLPCLVILDINMPGMDGRETLIRIRQSGHFSNMPVILFSTSSSPSDREFAMKWEADFITKPLVFSELLKLAQTFVDRCTHEVSKRA